MRGLPPPPQKPCRTELTPLFEAAGAVFNDETGYYELNGLTDITETEAIKMILHYTRSARTPYSQLYLGSDCRTFFPLKYVDIPYSWAGSHRECRNLVYANIIVGNKLLISDGTFMFWNCFNLKEIFTTLNFFNSTAFKAGNMFKECRLLETVKIESLAINLAISETPFLSIESVLHLVEKSINKDAITITVHPDVYAKLMDEANTEWYAVNTSAQAKNIAFATTESTQAVALAAKILPEIIAMDGELLAPVGHYMTQASETAVEDRLFLSRKVLLSGEDVASWRVATEEERQEQEDYFKKSIEVYEKGN